jgi:hypothetical protein
LTSGSIMATMFHVMKHRIVIINSVRH